MSKHRANVASGLVSARNASVSTQNKQLAMPDRDTLKTQSWVMRHDKTWKLNREPRQDIQVSRLSQDRDMKKTCLETRHVSRDAVTAISSWIPLPQDSRRRRRSLHVAEYMFHHRSFIRVRKGNSVTFPDETAWAGIHRVWSDQVIRLLDVRNLRMSFHDVE